MPPSCTVLIGSADLLPALKALAGVSCEVLTFTDGEVLRALEEITRRRPEFVMLDPLFAASPRGLALINRIKADPALSGSEIRVLSHDGKPASGAPRPPFDGSTSAAIATAPVAAPAAPETLDQRGTRRAQRHKMAVGVEAMVDGNPVTVVDLSTCGAQVLSAAILRPNQRVRLTFSDEQGTMRVNAAVAWASFEIIPGRAPQYRAGLEFVGADATSIDAYCARHRA